MSPALQRQPMNVALADDARVTVSLFLPERPLATLMCLPALGVTAGYYEPLALALAAQGVAVATADLRGLGEHSVRARRGVDFGYAAMADDSARVAAALRQRFSQPLFVLGHSLGGHIAALVAGSHPKTFDGLLLCASGTPHWRRYPLKTAAGVLTLAHLSRALGATLGYFPGKRVGFGGTEAAQLMREWGSLARKGRLSAAGLDAEHIFAQVAVPTLAVSLEGDWMAPRAAVDHLTSKLGRAPITRIHLTAECADPRGLDHFRWVKYPESVAVEIVRWIANIAARPPQG